jgi:hypothetical protein
METFDQIWESSRRNAWSGYAALTIWSGLAAIVVLSLVPFAWPRRIAKVVAVIGFAYYVALYSSLETSEKWRIRRAWAAAHKDLMTEVDQYALTGDGANLLAGPIIVGVQATALLFVVAAATEFGNAIWSSRRAKMSEASGVP